MEDSSSNSRDKGGRQVAKTKDNPKIKDNRITDKIRDKDNLDSKINKIREDKIINKNNMAHRAINKSRMASSPVVNNLAEIISNSNMVNSNNSMVLVKIRDMGKTKAAAPTTDNKEAPHKTTSSNINLNSKLI